MAKNPKHTNSLIDSTSPYLLQHAHNPVNWYQWSKEALNEANKGNLKFINQLLEILNKPYIEQKNIFNYQIPSQSSEQYQTFCGT